MNRSLVVSAVIGAAAILATAGCGHSGCDDCTWQIRSPLFCEGGCPEAEPEEYVQPADSEPADEESDITESDEPEEDSEEPEMVTSDEETEEEPAESFDEAEVEEDCDEPGFRGYETDEGKEDYLHSGRPAYSIRGARSVDPRRGY